jgi:hypothetical protein
MNKLPVSLKGQHSIVRPTEPSAQGWRRRQLALAQRWSDLHDFWDGSQSSQIGPHLVQPSSKSPTAITDNSKASRRNIWKNYPSHPGHHSLRHVMGLALPIKMRHQNEFAKYTQSFFKVMQEDPNAPGVILDGL